MHEIPQGKINKKAVNMINTLKWGENDNQDNVIMTVLTERYFYVIRNNSIDIYGYLGSKGINKEKSWVINIDDASKIECIRSKNIITIHSKSTIHVVVDDTWTTQNQNFEICSLTSTSTHPTWYCMAHITRDSLMLSKLNLDKVTTGFANTRLTLSSNNINTVQTKINVLAISPFNANIITLSTDTSIHQFDLSESTTEQYTFANTFSHIVFSELITYVNGEDTSTKKNGAESQRYTMLSSFKHNDIVNIFSNLVASVVNDIIEIVKGIEENVNGFINKIQQSMNKNIKIKEQENEEISYSLFVFTRSNELHVLNAFNGNIKFTEQFSKDQTITWLKIIKRNDKEKIIREASNLFVDLVFEINGKRELRTYDLINNKLTTSNSATHTLHEELKSLQSKLIRSKESFMNINGKINISRDMKESWDSKYAIHVEDSTLYGIKYTLDKNGDLIMNIAYNFKTEELISYHIPYVNQNYIPVYFVEGKIFYKFINENIIVILSKHLKKRSWVISLLDGTTGRLIEQNYIINVNFNSVKVLFEDNWGIVSYIKNEKGFKRNEIFSIELMKREIEYSLLAIFDKAFTSGTADKSSLSYGDITILSHTYAIERRVKYITKSTSEYNNANKFVIIVFDNNKIFSFDRRTFSPRRPIMKDEKGKSVFDPLGNSMYVDPALPGYDAVVGLDYKSNLDRNANIGNIDKVLINPTENESTFLLCSIGDDIACYKVFPDKTYDKWSLVFSYWVILAIVMGCVFGISMLRRYVRRQEIKNVFWNN